MFPSLGWTVWAALAVAAPARAASDTVEILVVATTDMHGHVYHWDYVRDREAPWGLTRAATVVDSLRRTHPGRVVLVDAGDLIQGSPFATYYSATDTTPPHPVVEALNAVGYDALAPGNHEFNWGLEGFGRVLRSATFPVVAGNVYWPDGTPALEPYAVVERGGVRIGIAGFTTPGAMVWDRAHLAGRVEVRPILPEAERVLTRMAEAGLGLRVVAVHSGMSSPSSYAARGVGEENVADLLAGLPVAPHVVIVGHTDQTIVDSVVGGVHFVQPPPRTRALAVVSVRLVEADGATGHRVVGVRAEHVQLGEVPPQPALAAKLGAAHETVRAWVAEPVARVEGDWSARYARAEDTPIIDFVNEVQRRAAGAQLSATAAFNPRGAFGPDRVYLRDVAGVYPYENTLKSVRLTGADLVAYLEQSAAYFRTYRPGEPVVDTEIPGYNFDIVSGVEYVIDLRRPVGDRIRQLRYRGEPVAPHDTFTVAVNNYRQGGGGGFEMVSRAPVVYDGQENVRDLVVQAARAAGVLRADDYFRPSWRIVPQEAADAVRRMFEPAEGGSP